jgi:hypothetical protein
VTCGGGGKGSLTCWFCSSSIPVATPRFSIVMRDIHGITGRAGSITTLLSILASTSSAGFRTASLDLALSDVDGSVPRLNLRRGVLEVGLDFIGSKRSPSLGREPHGNPLARRLDVNALDLLGL